MENLTESLRVVFNVPDCNPVPDHDIVVFNKLGVAGLEFRELVPAGSRFKKRVFERGELEAFAVSRDENIKHVFSHPDKHSDEIHSYILRFTLSIKVSNPRTIVEKLKRDPIKQLQRETTHVIGDAARYLDWKIIAEGHKDLETSLLAHDITTEDNVVLSNLERIRRVAQDFGIEVKGVSIQRNLPERETKVAWTEREIDETIYIENREQELNLDRKKRDQKIRGYDDKKDIDGAINRMVVEIIKGVGSGSDCVLPLENLSRVKEEVRKLIGPGPSDVSTAPGSRLLAAAKADNLLGDLIVQVLQLKSSLDNSSPAQQRLGSLLLHLIAELSLGSNAEDEVLQTYAEKLGENLRDREIYRRLRLDSRQIKLVDRLREPLQLKDEISREEER